MVRQVKIFYHCLKGSKECLKDFINYSLADKLEVFSLEYWFSNFSVYQNYMEGRCSERVSDVPKVTRGAREKSRTWAV